MTSRCDWQVMKYPSLMSSRLIIMQYMSEMSTTGSGGGVGLLFCGSISIVRSGKEKGRAMKQLVRGE